MPSDKPDDMRDDHPFSPRQLAALDKRFDAVDKRFELFRVELNNDFARHVNVLIEHLTPQIAAVGEPYKDIPARVAALEAKQPRDAGPQEVPVPTRGTKLDAKLPARVAKLEQAKLPARVAKLEAAVFPPKRTRRRRTA